jgi:hypothetical protein
MAFLEHDEKQLQFKQRVLRGGKLLGSSTQRLIDPFLNGNSEGKHGMVFETSAKN